MKLREKKSMNSKERAVLTASRFAALETESNSPRNEYRMKTTIFYSSFPLNRVHVNKKKWVTLVILTSCKHNRELFIASRNSNNLYLINYYKNTVKYYLLSLRKQKN